MILYPMMKRPTKYPEMYFDNTDVCGCLCVSDSKAPNQMSRVSRMSLHLVNDEPNPNCAFKTWRYVDAWIRFLTAKHTCVFCLFVVSILVRARGYMMQLSRT